MKQIIIKSGLIALFTILSFSLVTQAQERTNSTVIKVKTSAVCTTCKQKIEHDLSFAKGVKMTTLDLQSRIATVEYDPRKTNETEIKKAISLIGYDADELKADAKAYKKLPACCKKENAPH